MKVTTYNEPVLRARVARLDANGRATVAGAIAQCAATAWPTSKTAAEPDILRAPLGRLWAALRGASYPLHDQDEQDVLAAIPTDEGEWDLRDGYAQSSGAAVVYAIRALRTKQIDDVIWAARQLYELADYAAQSASPSAGIIDSLREVTIEGDPIVQQAVGLINRYVTTVESDALELETLRAEAESDGIAFASQLP